MEVLTAKRRDELIDWFVDQCAKRGLIAPAIMFLEVNRPMTFIASSGVTFLAPILGAALKPNMMEEIAALLEDRKNIDLIIGRLEKASEEVTRREREQRQRVQEERKRRRLARQGKLPADASAQPTEAEKVDETDADSTDDGQ